MKKITNNIILNNILGILFGIGYLVYKIALIVAATAICYLFFAWVFAGVVLILFGNSVTNVLIGIVLLFIAWVFWKITDDEKQEKEDENTKA